MGLALTISFCILKRKTTVPPGATLHVSHPIQVDFWFCGVSHYRWTEKRKTFFFAFAFHLVLFLYPMTRLHRVAAAGIACLAFAGVHVTAQNLKDGQCVTNFDANTDYFPEKLNTRKYKTIPWCIAQTYKQSVICLYRRGGWSEILCHWIPQQLQGHHWSP